MATDLFFLESDRHRVVLLAKLLAKLGIDTVSISNPTESTSDPALVICTCAALNERWLTDVFGGSGSVVALVLDNDQLPRSCTQAVDLTSWPARSADSEVAGLVRWLKNPTAGTRFGEAAARRFKAIGARGGRRNKAGAKRDGASAWVTASLLTGIAAGFGLLLWSAMPDIEPGIEPDNQLGNEPHIPLEKRVEVPQDAVTQSSAAVPRVEPMPPRGALAAPDSAPSDHHDQPGVVSDHSNDALSRLCRARNAASARAWLGTLNWKQRRRLDDLACVARLAARPGFEPFAILLGVAARS